MRIETDSSDEETEMRQSNPWMTVDLSPRPDAESMPTLYGTLNASSKLSYANTSKRLTQYNSPRKTQVVTRKVVPKKGLSKDREAAIMRQSQAKAWNQGGLIDFGMTRGNLKFSDSVEERGSLSHTTATTVFNRTGVNWAKSK